MVIVQLLVQFGLLILEVFGCILRLGTKYDSCHILLIILILGSTLPRILAASKVQYLFNLYTGMNYNSNHN